MYILNNFSSRLNHSHFNLNADENDFASLDFAALDRLAGYEDGEEEAQVQGWNERAEGGGSVRSNSPVEVQQTRATSSAGPEHAQADV